MNGQEQEVYISRSGGLSMRVVRRRCLEVIWALESESDMFCQYIEAGTLSDGIALTIFVYRHRILSHYIVGRHARGGTRRRETTPVALVRRVRSEVLPGSRNGRRGTRINVTEIERDAEQVVGEGISRADARLTAMLATA